MTDRQTLLAGRDDESLRWLGPESPTPSPTAVIEAAGHVVGWVDAGTELTWLRNGEVNIGYAVFPQHRGRGYAAQAMHLLLEQLAVAGDVSSALLVIDRRNPASVRVAEAIGARATNHPAAAHYPTSTVYVVKLTGPMPPIVGSPQFRSSKLPTRSRRG